MTEKAKGYWRMEPNFPGPQDHPIGGGCQFIEGDPKVALANKVDPHCNKPRVSIHSAYCEEHHRRCYYVPNGGR